MANQKHEHGSMSTDDQEKTFASFVGVVSKSVVVIAVALVFVFVFFLSDVVAVFICVFLVCVVVIELQIHHCALIVACHNLISLIVI